MGFCLLIRNHFPTSGERALWCDCWAFDCLGLLGWIGGKKRALIFVWDFGPEFAFSFFLKKKKFAALTPCERAIWWNCWAVLFEVGEEFIFPRHLIRWPPYMSVWGGSGHLEHRNRVTFACGGSLLLLYHIHHLPKNCLENTANGCSSWAFGIHLKPKSVWSQLFASPPSL